MTLEIWFIHGDILYPYHIIVGKFDNFIYQQERNSVRQLVFDIVDIIYRWLIRVVNRCFQSYFVGFDILLNYFRKRHIAGMTESMSYNFCIDAEAGKC